MNQGALQLDFEDDGYPVNFWRWLRANQHVYRAFCAYAFRMAMTGRKRYSARTIVERIRWDTDLSDNEETFKINDHYTPGMARLFMSEYGEKYPGFFQLRDSLGR
jgi:hypothetical protein